MPGRKNKAGRVKNRKGFKARNWDSGGSRGRKTVSSRKGKCKDCGKKRRGAERGHGVSRSSGWDANTGGKAAWNRRGPGGGRDRSGENEDRDRSSMASNAAQAPARTAPAPSQAPQRPQIDNWYHRSDLYSNPELTKSTSVAEWNETIRRKT